MGQTSVSHAKVLGHQAPEVRPHTLFFLFFSFFPLTWHPPRTGFISQKLSSEVPPAVSNNLLLHVKPHPGNFPLHTAKNNSQGALSIGKTQS